MSSTNTRKSGKNCECGKELIIKNKRKYTDLYALYLSCDCGYKYTLTKEGELKLYYRHHMGKCDCGADMRKKGTTSNNKGRSEYFECKKCYKKFRITNGVRFEVFDRICNKKTHNQVDKLKPTHPLGRIIKGYAMSGSPRDTERTPDKTYIGVSTSNYAADIDDNKNFDDSEIRFLITGGFTITKPVFGEIEYMEAA